MAGISTSITLRDGVTSKLDKIDAALNKVILSFMRLDKVANGINLNLDNLNVNLNDISVNPKVDAQVDQLSKKLDRAAKNAEKLKSTLSNTTASGLVTGMLALPPARPEPSSMLALPAPQSLIPTNMSTQLVDQVYMMRQLYESFFKWLQSRAYQTRDVIDLTANAVVTDAIIDVKQLEAGISATAQKSEEVIRHNVQQSGQVVQNGVQHAEQLVRNAGNSVTQTVKRAVGNVGNQVSKLGSQINGTTSRIASSFGRITPIIMNLKTKIVGLAQTRLDSLKRQFEDMDSSINKTEKSTSRLITKLKWLASVYLGVMGMRAIVQTGDTMTSAENQLRYVGMQQGMSRESADQFGQDAMDKMFTSANKVRTSFPQMMKNVGKSMTLAGDSFDNNIDNAIRFQEVMSEAYTIAGASAQEQESSMYQMMQALGSGILQGDELRSVREGAPLAYKAIEEFAQGVYNTDESLKDLASDGMITSQIVVAAITNAGDAMDKAFGDTTMTFAQMWTIFKNNATMAFKPFLEKLSEIANSDAAKFIGDKLIKGVWTLGAAFEWLADKIQIAVNFIANNWDLVRNALILVAAVLGGIVLQAIVNVTGKMLGLLLAGKLVNLEFLMATLAIVGFIMLVQQYAEATGDLVYGIGQALFVVGTMVAVVGMAMMAAGMAASLAWLPVVVVIALVVAALGILLAFTGDVVGRVMWAAGAIANVVIGITNALIQAIWSIFVEPFMGIIEWVINAANGGFNNFGDAVANLIGKIVGWFLGLGKVVTKIIDAIFGTDWTSGLEGLRSEMIDWGKNNNAITLDTEAPQFDRLNLGDAYDYGKTVGDGWHNAIGDGISGLTDKVKGSFDIESKMKGANKSIVPDLSNINNNLKGIGDDTGKMSKKMDLTAEDLKYLRQLAEQETVNRFTTAEIKIDMTNNNNVNEGADLDGVVAYLTDTLREEMGVLAAGVHV